MAHAKFGVVMSSFAIGVASALLIFSIASAGAKLNDIIFGVGLSIFLLLPEAWVLYQVLQRVKEVDKE